MDQRLSLAVSLTHTHSLCSRSPWNIEYSSAVTIPVYTHTHTLIVTLHLTCWYDEIKGPQGLKICFHADSQILSHSPSIYLTAFFSESEVAESSLGYTTPEAPANSHRPQLKRMEEAPAGCRPTTAGAHWYTFEDNVVWCEVMNIAWIAHDCQACPGLRAEDGHMNILFSRGHSRLQLMSSFLKGVL